MSLAAFSAFAVACAVQQVQATLLGRLNAPTAGCAPKKWGDLPPVRTPIVFFGPYSGSLPSTFPLTIASMRANVECCTFIALHAGDEDPVADKLMLQAVESPPNFHWVHIASSDLEHLFLETVGTKVSAGDVVHQMPQPHHKWNDWRVFAPVLLKGHLTPSVEYWGYLEHDAIYGIVDDFLPSIRKFDVFTAGEAGLDRVSGPFVLHRLGTTTESFIQRWKDEGCLRQPNWLWCDEAVVTDCIQHPVGSSSAPCAPKGLRHNFPVEERRFCEPQQGVAVGWTMEGEALCDGESVLGLHFHFQRPDAAAAIKSLGAEEYLGLMKNGWSFEPSIRPDPDCPNCITALAKFQAGASSKRTHPFFYPGASKKLFRRDVG